MSFHLVTSLLAMWKKLKPTYVFDAVNGYNENSYIDFDVRIFEKQLPLIRYQCHHSANIQIYWIFKYIQI